jgi:Zn-dependent M28 family amino/carboxypeptidase
MLELARGVAQRAHGFKSGILFLFNTGEEEGLDGAHSFITQVSIFKLHTNITHMCCKIALVTTCSIQVNVFKSPSCMGTNLPNNPD